MSELRDQWADATNLQIAWRDIARKRGAAGLDGQSIDDFTARAAAELRALRDAIRAGTYMPYALRGIVMPKEGGGTRRLAIPTVRDRIAQRALLAILQPRCDPYFRQGSYAYRPGRSIRDAIDQVAAWRDADLTSVARVDVRSCFDAIPRDRLLSAVRSFVPEDDVIEIIHRWLWVPIVYDGCLEENSCGIPQGNCLSPLLCNIYLHALDDALTSAGYAWIRYADDMVILAASVDEVASAVTHVEAELYRLDLTLNPEKTRLTTFEDGFRYLGAVFVRHIALPCMKITVRASPPRYVTGYDAAPRARRGRKAVQLLRKATAWRACAEGLTEDEIASRIYRAVNDALSGHRSALGRQLLAIWRREVAAANPSPSDDAAHPGVYIIQDV